MNVPWYEIALITIGFLIRWMIEIWMDLHTAELRHRIYVLEWQLAQERGQEPPPVHRGRRRRPTEMPWERIAASLAAHKQARAVRIDGEWRA